MNADLLAIVSAGSGVYSPSATPARLRSGGGVPDESILMASSLSEPAVELGPSLVLIRDHSSICGGQYGARKNNCFCFSLLRGTRSCPGSHGTTKHSMFESLAKLNFARVYFLKGAGKNAAYAEPYLDVDGLDAFEISSLLNSKTFESWEEWRGEAVALKAALASKQDVEAVKTAIKATRTIPRLKPMSSRLDAAGAMGADFGVELDQRLKLLGSAIDELLKEGMMEVGTQKMAEGDDELEDGWQDTQGMDQLVLGRINLLQRALVELNEKAASSLKELQLGFGVRLAGLEAIIGEFSSVEYRKQQAGGSILGMVEALEDQIAHLRSIDHVHQLVVKVFQSTEMSNQNESVKEAFRAVMQRMVSLEQSMQEVQHSRVKPGGDENAGGMDWLGTAGHESSQERGNAWQVEDDSQIKMILQSMATRLDGLEQTLMPGNKAEGEDVTVSFMGIHFSSEDDVRSYVESLCDGRFEVPPGLVTDCYALFHALNREIFDGKSKLGVVDLAKVSSLNMAQSDVYNILAAAEHGLPDFFDPPTAASKIFIDGKQGKKHRFSNIASYEIWGPVGTLKDAVRKRAETQLTRYIRTKRLDLKVIKNPELRAFLINMLDLSKDFVEAVFSFLTEEYSALAEHFGDENLCWDFACSCIEHVFKYEFEAARAVVNNPDVADPGVKPKILWQSLRTISVQESFMRVGFKNHSSLSSAYSRFLLTQYQLTAAELAKVTKELDSNKRSFSELRGAVEGLEKRMKAAEGTANAAQNAVQKWKKHHD